GRPSPRPVLTFCSVVFASRASSAPLPISSPSCLRLSVSSLLTSATALAPFVRRFLIASRSSRSTCETPSSTSYSRATTSSPRGREVGARAIGDEVLVVHDRFGRDRRVLPVFPRHDLEVLLAEHAGRVDEVLGVLADRILHAIFDPRGDAHLHALVQLRIHRAA